MKHHIPTPRTDEEEWSAACEINDRIVNDKMVVDSTFARQLERELHEAIKERDDANKIASTAHRIALELESQCKALKAELAQYQPTVRSTEE